MHRWLLAIALLGGAWAAATARADGDLVVSARRAVGPVAVDGRVDEGAWEGAAAYARFVQISPDEGAPPSDATEVRVLFDDRHLYVGIVCRDVGEVAQPLGRRDAPPYSDKVTVLVDPTGARRAALTFAVTSAGVQEDGIHHDDGYQRDWDAVWSGAAAVHPGGWSAELAIPLATLRPTGAASWGFAVRREIARTHETVSSVPYQRSSHGIGARLGLLDGVAGVEPPRGSELSAYSAVRVAARPKYSDDTQPEPRLVDPMADVGVDWRSAFARDLVLNVTVNPDFGQVEADQVVQNLTRYEAFFPEKRPFFLESMDEFQPLGATGAKPVQQLFYSRRIGLAAPILGAAKLTGRASDTVRVGLLNAFVAAAERPEMSEKDPDRRFQLRLERPFHLASLDTLPARAPPAQNYLAGVARWRPATTLEVAGTATSAVPLGPSCTESEARATPEVREPRCDARGGNAAALDSSLRSRDGAWALAGQVVGSQVVGGPPARTLSDGTELSRGDLGIGGHLTAGRVGGEPWRFELRYRHASPTLELNASGFQQKQNDQTLGATATFVRPGGGGPFLSYSAYVSASRSWTADGRYVMTGNSVAVGTEGTFRSQHTLSCDVGLDGGAYDVREITRTGIPYGRAGSGWATCGFATDGSRRVSVDGGATVGRSFAEGALGPAPRLGGNVGVTVRPGARLDTRLWLSVERNAHQARYLTSDGDEHIFADLDAAVLSIVLRQQLALSPRLTLQAFAQLFSEYGRYGRRYTATSVGRVAIEPDQLTPELSRDLGGMADFRSSALNVNVVLRWEYRPGSTLYAVYARSQWEPSAAADVRPAATLSPGGIRGGPAIDSFMVKWTHWWSL